MSTPQATSQDVPATWRCATWLRYAVTVASAVAVGAIGTVAHRMGAAQGIPYGMVLAWVLVAASAWCARARTGIAGLALHLTVSTLVVYFMAMAGPGGDVLIPVGFGSDTVSWWSQHSGYLWMFGMLGVQLIGLVLPRRVFALPGAAPTGDARGL